MRMAPLAALLFGAVCLAGCDERFDNLVIVPSTTGTFILQSVNGNPLPAIIADSVTPPLRIEVLSGHLILRTDGTFEDAVEFQNTLAGTQTTNTVVCPGTYFVSGNTINFTETGTGVCTASFIGVVSDRTITTTIRGNSLVFVQ